MKAKIFIIGLVVLLVTAVKLEAQTKEHSKTVLLINAHLPYPGLSEGTLNKSFYEEAKKFFISQMTT